MKPEEKLYCIICRDDSPVEGAGAEILSAFDYNLSTWRDEETKIVHHTLYFLTPAERDTAFEQVQNLAKEWLEYDVRLVDFIKHDIKREDWAEVWKIHFKPIEISDRLAIKPSWEKFQAKPGQVVLILDPGMSFGTGQHATTKFCLGALDKFIFEAKQEGRKLSFLDAGSGSGILAIAAYKLGYSPVAAFDYDGDTIDVARENAQTNGVPDADLPFDTAALADYQNVQQYDVVAANILCNVLIRDRKKLLSMVKPGGRLILAGIQAKEYADVRRAYEEIGCKEIFTIPDEKAGWQGGAFTVPDGAWDL